MINVDKVHTRRKEEEFKLQMQLKREAEERFQRYVKQTDRPKTKLVVQTETSVPATNRRQGLI